MEGRKNLNLITLINLPVYRKYRGWKNKLSNATRRLIAKFRMWESQ